MRSPRRPVTSRRRLATWGDLAGLSRGDRLLRARGAAKSPRSSRGARGRTPARPHALATRAWSGRLERRAGSACPRASEPLAAPVPGPWGPQNRRSEPVSSSSLCLSHVNAFTIAGSFERVPFPAGRHVRRVGCPPKDSSSPPRRLLPCLL